MKAKRVEVLPHARNPVGNFAVIRLVGVSRLDGPATYRLDPVSSQNGQQTAFGWPKGDLSPLGVRSVNGNVELLIGPEVVKAVALKPGVEVVLRMPAAGVETQLQWPDLSGKFGAPIAARQAENSPRQEEEVLSGGKEAAPEIEKGLARLKRTQPKIAAPLPAPPPLPPQPNRPRVAQSPAESGEPPPTAAPAAVLATSAGSLAAPTAVEAPPPALDAPPPLARAAVSQNSLSFMPMLLGLVIVAAMFIAMMRTTTNASGVTLFAAFRQTVAGEPASDDVGLSSAVVAEILKTGSRSPGGADVSDVTEQQALQRAGELLALAKTPADRAEAAFWLRKALSHSLARPRLVWAVTQLGAAYASPGKAEAPDFKAARLLWSWAADAGDAEAACFLAHLYMRGYGVASNPKLARENYAHARRQAGKNGQARCPELEQAMFRGGK